MCCLTRGRSAASSVLHQTQCLQQRLQTLGKVTAALQGQRLQVERQSLSSVSEQALTRGRCIAHSRLRASYPHFVARGASGGGKLSTCLSSPQPPGPDFLCCAWHTPPPEEGRPQPPILHCSKQGGQKRLPGVESRAMRSSHQWHHYTF